MQSSRTGKVLVLSSGRILTKFIGLASAMVMVRMLTQGELATYRQTILAYEVAIPLFSLGLEHAILFYLPPEKTRLRGIVVDALLMMVLMGFLYAIFILSGGNHILAKRFSNPAIVKTLIYMAPLPMIMIPASLLDVIMVVQNRINKLVIYNVLTNLAIAGSVIVACLLWATPEALVLTMVSVNILISIIALILIFQAVPNDEWHPRLGNMKAMLIYSLPLVLAGSIATISLHLDKIIVSSFCSKEEFAVYSVGAIRIPIIGIVTGAISKVLVVDFRREYAANNLSEALRLYRLVPIKTTVFLFPVMVFCMIAAKPLMVVLFSEKYVASTMAFMLYLLIIPFRTILLGGLASVGKSKIILRNSAVALLFNLILSILLVHIMGYYGAIIATVLTLLFWGIPITLYEISRSLKTTMAKVYPWKTVGINLLISIIAGIPSGLVLLVLRDYNKIMQLALSSMRHS